MFGVVVVPHGCGQSLNCGAVSNLVSSGSLQQPRDVTQLAELGRRASLDNAWYEYTRYFGHMIRDEAKPGDVVMVNDIELAFESGGEYLGSVALQREVWEEKVVSRGELPSKVAVTYNRTVVRRDCVVFTNQGILNRYLRFIAQDFIRTRTTI